MADEPENIEAEAEVPSSASEPELGAAGEPSAVTSASAPEAETAKPRRRRTPKKSATQPAALTPEQKHQARLEERRRKAALRRVERARTRGKRRRASGDAAGTTPREHGPGKQKTRQGVVVSDRAAKTITVRIDVTHRHPRYSKIVRTSSTLHAHDERDEAHIGDTVVVRECRPLSRTKRWRLVQVLERAE